MTDPDPIPPAPIESPCVLVCSIEPETGLCWGCGRTAREIGAWSVMTSEGRSEVMSQLPERMAALPERRAKRVTRRRAARDNTGADG